MKEFLKKQTVGNYIAAGAALTGLIAFILYLINGTATGYFKGTNESSVIVMSIFAILALCGAIALSQFKFEGKVGDVSNIGVGVLRVVGAVLLVASLILFISSRAEGLAFIFGSNKDVIAEVQTPENMSSAGVAIAGFVFYIIAWLASVVASFFKIVKE